MGLGGLQDVAERPTIRVLRRDAHRRHAPEPVSDARPGDRLRGAGIAALPAAAIVLFGGVEPAHALPLEAAALLLGAWAVVARARRGEQPLPLPAITLPVLVLAAIPALQLLPLPAGLPALIAPGLRRAGIVDLQTISVAPAETWQALLRWLAYAAFLIAALEALRRPAAVSTALTVVGALGVAEAVYGVGNLLLGNAWLLWLPRQAGFADATGTLVNRNHYATVFELCLPALLARRWLGHGRRDEAGRTALYLGAAATMAVAVLLSRSRAGIVCSLAGLVVAAALTPRRHGASSTRRMLLAAGLLGVLVAGWLGLGPVVGRFEQLGGREAAIRPALWGDALPMAADFPVAGLGAGAFGGVFPAYRRRLTDQVGFSHAHQDYLQLAIETGIPGVLLTGVAMLAFVRMVRAPLAGRLGAPVALLCGGLVAVLVHAAFDFPLHIPGIVFLLLLVAAATLALAGRARLDKAAPER